MVSKEKKDKIVDPFNIKLVQSIVLSHNVAGVAALHLTDAAQVMQGFSHLIIESQSLGLLLRFILNNYSSSIKMDFADSISLSESGCLDELRFQQLFGQGNNSFSNGHAIESDGSLS